MIYEKKIKIYNSAPGIPGGPRPKKCKKWRGWVNVTVPRTRGPGGTHG